MKTTAQRADGLPNRMAGLRLRHFLLFEQLLAEGTMHKAARAMNITQPAASLMLRELESAVGATLFLRSRRGMSATPVGLALCDRVRAITGEARLITTQNPAEYGGTPLISVGALPRVMLDLMPLVADRVRRHWPELRLRVVEGVASQLLAALDDGQVDCVIARLPHDRVTAPGLAELHQSRLYDEGMCIVAGAGSPWARRRKIDIGTLASADWILPPAGTEAREVLTNTFLQAGQIPPQPRIESLAVVTNMGLVQQLPCLTVAPVAASLDWQKQGRLKVLPVKLNQPLSPIAFICRRVKLDTGGLQRLRVIVEDCAARLHRT